MQRIVAFLFCLGSFAPGSTFAHQCLPTIDVVADAPIFESDKTLTTQQIAAGLYHNYFNVPEAGEQTHVGVGTFKLHPDIKTNSDGISGVDPYHIISERTGWESPSDFTRIQYHFHDAIHFDGLYFDKSGNRHSLSSYLDLEIECFEFCGAPPLSPRPIFYAIEGSDPKYFKILGGHCNAFWPPPALPEIVEAFGSCARNGGCEDWLYQEDD